MEPEAFSARALRTKNYKLEISQNVTHFCCLLCQPAEIRKTETKLCLLMEKDSVQVSATVNISESLNPFMQKQSPNSDFLENVFTES